MSKSRVPPTRISRDLRIARARRAIEHLARAVELVEEEFAAELDALAPRLRESGFNLVHYLAARRYDLRPLQDDLARLGLSTLGHLEPHVHESLRVVREALAALAGEPTPESGVAPPIDIDTGPGVLREHADALLGSGDQARIMVTMPSEASDDPALIRDLLAEGMTVMRINCAHDGPEAWARMVKRLRRAEREAGRTCRVAFDLAGPKLRTGTIDAGVAVAKWRPDRDRLGKVFAPAQVRFRTRGSTAGEDPGIVLEGPVIAKARSGDLLVLSDARGRERVLVVREVNGSEILCESNATAYVVPGTPVMLKRGQRVAARGRIGALPATPQWILLRPGDSIAIVLGDEPGHDVLHDDDGAVIESAAAVLPPARGVPERARRRAHLSSTTGASRGVIRAVDRRPAARRDHPGAPAAAPSCAARRASTCRTPNCDLPALTAQDLRDLDVRRAPRRHRRAVVRAAARGRRRSSTRASTRSAASASASC